MSSAERRPSGHAACHRLLAALVAIVAGLLAVTSSDPTSAYQSPSLSLVKVVALTTDAEGGSARPEVIDTQDRVFVLYLGDIGSGAGRTFKVKVFDGGLDSLIASNTLVSTTTEYGGPTDIRVASDGQYAYAFYETNKQSSPTSSTTYLWGAKYALNDSFDRVAYTPAPITTSEPLTDLPEGGEMVDDPAPLVGPASVFVVTRIKHSLSMSGNTVYRVREFSKDNLTKLSEFDLDLSSAADGRGRVASLLSWNNSIYMALATTVSDQGIIESVDDGAKSDLVLVRMTQTWSFDPQQDVFALSAQPDDVENYVPGFKTDGNNFYVAYKQSVGVPPAGEHRAQIDVFDGNFNPVYQETVRTTVWGPGGGEMRPSLEVAGSRVLSGQSAGASLGSGNAEVYVYALDTDGDGAPDSTDPDDENDGFSDVAEAGSPLCGDGRNEDDGDDSLTDDGCPGGPPQAGAYSEAGFNIGTAPRDTCGTDGWPLDFVSGGIPDSTNRVTITDLTSFLAPERRLGTSPGVAGFDSRWDLAPGKGLFTSWIAINDLTALLSGQTGNPPMLGGARAFNGPACPFPP